MKTYRRSRVPGGVFFFTVVTRRRAPWLTDADALNRLREAMRKVQSRRPFGTDAIVIMPDHLHAIWRLPEGDADFSTRWRQPSCAVFQGRRRNATRARPSGHPSASEGLW